VRPAACHTSRKPAPLKQKLSDFRGRPPESSGVALPPYYSRFGFAGEKAAGLKLPGPFERHRLLALELVPNALDGAGGLLRATGRLPHKSQARAA